MELRNLWNLYVRVMPIMIRVLGIVLKSLGKRLEELKTVKILRKVLVYYGDLLSPNFQFKPTSTTTMNTQ